MTRRQTHGHEPLGVGDCLSERYTIVERITAGGHSIVYRGEDQRLSRPVCVKVFHRLNAKDNVYQTAYEHFVQEAFALSKLTHPNTLRIYDFGYLAGETEDEYGPPFQISEFMNYGTLTSLVQRGGPMQLADAARIVHALGGALAEAHGCGIIHRDIKPPNILFSMVGRTWVTKLADFGIAKSLPEAAEGLVNQAEDTAVVAGRPLLMYSLRWAAPEQLIGRPVTAAADVYSLALTFAFMLTGNVVFVARDKMDPLEQRRRSDVFVETAFSGREVPPRVIELLMRACTFDPRKRPSDVEEFTDELGAAMATERQTPTPRPRLQTVPSAPNRTAPRAGTPLPPRRITTESAGEQISDRRGYFVRADAGHADITCAGGAARLRCTFIPKADGFCFHVKGLNCFVARGKGRPTSAVQFDRDGRCALVTPSQQPIANVAISLGAPAAGHRVFTIGSEAVALSIDECPQVATLDFGPGNDCVFVFRPGAAAGTAHKRSLWRKPTSQS